MQQHWADRKGNLFANTPNTRSLTPKLGSSWRDELERTPERLKTDISQILSYTPSSSFHQKKLSGLSSTLTPKQTSKVIESSNSGEKLRTHKSQKSQHNLSNTYHGTSLTQMKTKPLNNNNPFQGNTSPTNNENNYLNQVNIMIQKITKLKQELDVSKEKENQCMIKLSNLEKENKSLLVLLDEKEKKIQEITRKAKEDKIKMYQFLTELEAYKEANREREKDESTVRLSEIADSLKKAEKPMTISRCIQTIEEGIVPCPKCQALNSYTEILLQRMSEIEENTRLVMEEYNQMKEMLEGTKKSEINYAKAKSEFESKYSELQKQLAQQEKEIAQQANICSQLAAENTTIRANLCSLLEDNSSVPIAKKSTSNKIASCLPSTLKALIYSERLLNSQTSNM